MRINVLTVCRLFDCHRRIDIECLKPHESYELYMKILGKETSLPKLGKGITKSIVNNRGGLPLAVIITARNMRGITDVRQLRNGLYGQMQKTIDSEIFENLRRSYDELKGPALQHCFLYCPSFIDEGCKELGDFLVDLGLVKRMKTRRKELEETYTMVKILQDVCLLEIEEDTLIQVNAVIQRMAFQIMEETQDRIMMVTEELPNVEIWTDDLVKVSLANSYEIKNIPSNYLPSCSKLSTLLFSRIIRDSVQYIGDSFFEGFPALKSFMPFLY